MTTSKSNSSWDETLSEDERKRLESLDGAEHDYLWNPQASPDEEIVSLERALRPLAEEGAIPSNATSSTVWPRVVAVAATVLSAVGLTVWMIEQSRHGASTSAPGATSVSHEGSRHEWSMVNEGQNVPGHLPLGTWLETGDRERVRLEVADIGELSVHEHSRLRIVESHNAAHRVELARGKLSAVVNAPPRLFVVDTPSARAVDLGCAYELEVDDEGRSHLRVTAGSVSLENSSWHVHVPAGASCTSSKRDGPGIAWFDDANPDLRKRVLALIAGDVDSLGDMASKARPQDSLSLYQVLPRVKPAIRDSIGKTLARLVPLPEGTRFEAAMKLDPQALEAWWEEIEMTW